MIKGNGWIKLHRKLWDNPVVTKDPEHLAVWIYLLTNATHERHKTLYGGKPITLKPGQLITGRVKISKATGVNQHKVDRVLKLFASEQQIEQQSNRYGSVISICKWDKYQVHEQQSEQRVSNNRATSEQQSEQLKDAVKQATAMGKGTEAPKSEQPPKRGTAQKVSTKQEEQEIQKISSSENWLSDTLTAKEWDRLKNTFYDVTGLIDLVDTQVIDPKEIKSAYKYILGVANKRNWPRK